MFKHLLVIALLSAPCLALAGQGMSVEDGFALASNSADAAIDTVIAPMQDGGAADSAHESIVGRGNGDIDAHAQNDSHAPNAPRSAHGTSTAEPANSHAHKSHGGKPAWQSLLPGVMK